MDFTGPTPGDYANVRSLNRAFLSVLCNSMQGKLLRQPLHESIRCQLPGLTGLQLERLSESPFLLMSLRERDSSLWHELMAVSPTADLLVARPMQATDRLIAAVLGFLWQLARHNAYATRLISGASPDWCERLADTTLVELMQNTAGREDLLVARFADESERWSRLLGPGISATKKIRVAAQLSVLQAMLTGAAGPGSRRLRAAACATPVPSAAAFDRRGRR